MSSEKFEVTIRPDPLARALVVGSGILLTAIGVTVLVFTRLPPAWRTLALLVWIWQAVREFAGFKDAHRRVDRIVVDSAGDVSVLSPDGQRMPARYLTGSFATPEIAWLRLRLPGGCRYGELVIRRRTAAAHWHRLSLVWHLGQRTFGHRGPT